MHKSLIDDRDFEKLFKRCMLLAPLFLLLGITGIVVGLLQSYLAVVIAGFFVLLVGIWMTRFVLLTWTRRRMMEQLHGGVGSVVQEARDNYDDNHS